MHTIAPSIENRVAEHHRGLPVWIRPTKTGQKYFTGLTRAKLYELAERCLVCSFSPRDPGNLKGCRFFHLQSILDYLERAEQREREKNADGTADPEAPPKGAPLPPLKGQTVFLANALTGGGNKYLIGVFASESAAWLAWQRELNQGRTVWIEPLRVPAVRRPFRRGVAIGLQRSLLDPHLGRPGCLTRPRHPGRPPDDILRAPAPQILLDHIRHQM